MSCLLKTGREPSISTCGVSFTAAKCFTPLLKQQGSGYIINTASSAGTLAGPEMAAYNVAKAGVVSLSETLKVELGEGQYRCHRYLPHSFRHFAGRNHDYRQNHGK